MGFNYENFLKEVRDSMTEEQKANVAKIKRNIEENNRMLEGLPPKKGATNKAGETIEEYILRNCKTKPESLHERYTEDEIADAVELLRMMRKLNKAIK